jgi:hypothetical protein
MSISLTTIFDGFPPENGYINHFFSSDIFI